ncbi:MAG: type II toxin-antitoxin system RelE/ParE family toxin [Candidatus Cryptobacteroides sp.]
MEDKFVYDVRFSNEAADFITALGKKAKEKIFFNINKVRHGVKDVDIFKKLENSDIWEFRTLHNRIAYRLFAFFDEENKRIIVVTHGIVKKTQKTPLKEIEKAERYRINYMKSE